MEKIEHLLASKLLSISAIQLQPDNPFTWASGWESPIYTDTRRTLSYPDIRTFIKIELCRCIIENFPDVQAVASVSTGAIPQGVLVADELNLSYAYVRSTPKDHGLENLIEGNLKPGQKVVLLEDIISTGANTLKAANDIRDAGCEVVGIVSMFSFDFPEATEVVHQIGVKFVCLTNYHELLRTALETNYINDDDVVALTEWHENPRSWIPKR
ncbi:MAG: orotate phosphoribosyltransferase [Muribaculaceae bacterium]|nr:orotate phosphoribosyltransferase [Muribaculaceae bacterium]